MIDLYSPTPEEPGRILAVDDLPGNLKVLERELRHAPFALTLAQSAAEALDLCAAQPFEGILMDVSLPVMDGIEACRRLRRLPLNAQTPLIFVSAVRIGEDWIAAGIEAGGVDYLVKPYVLSELMAKLGMMVRLSRQREAALAGERHRALLEVTGGAIRELAQPLAWARSLLDRILLAPAPPSREQLEELGDCLARAGLVLDRMGLPGSAPAPSLPELTDQD
jgi:CheY-like chemotaxis protein